MESPYHIQLCQETLGDKLSPEALEAVIAANLRQDGLFTGLVGHPEFHFDESLFEEAWAYVESQRQIVIHTLKEGEPPEEAWRAFGRLLHSVQDFYAHSNYVRLWASRYPEMSLPSVKEFNGLDEELVNSPELFSDHMYYPFEAITIFRSMRPLAQRLLPDDAHVNMNLDTPEMGPLFYYAMEGARQRSLLEFGLLEARLGEKELERFGVV
jgi:hypothetical protein